MSRLLVKGLPDNVTDERLRDVFSEKGEITYLRLFRVSNANLASIGYRSEEEAHEAVKYFNKSFMDGSQMTVEISRKPSIRRMKEPEVDEFHSLAGVTLRGTTEGTRSRRRSSQLRTKFKDRVENVVKQNRRSSQRRTMFKARATNYVAGDVLTRAIFTECWNSVAAGTNVMDLQRDIQMAVGSVAAILRCRARMINTYEEIAQVGTTSANGDREIGELIAKAMEAVGKEGVITIQDGKTLYNELEVVEGMKVDSGFISPHFITNQKNQICELEDPLVLIHEEKISNLNVVVKALELAQKNQRPLLIIAEDIESNAPVVQLLNKKLRAGLKLCAVEAPGFGENLKANLSDLATLTGAQVITQELGMNLELEMLGCCSNVTISIDDTVLLGGAGDKASIGERCEQIRSMMDESASEYDKKKLQERLAKLSGGVAVAVLKIGGASETEVGEKKDRVTDALNATKAAVEGGIVPGGGVALLYASKELEKLHPANLDQKIGVQIIQNALKMPVHTMASNAGVDGAVIVGKLLEQDNYDLGYDAGKGEYVDMVKAGIIDPLEVIRTALYDAASVASLLVWEVDRGGGMGGRPFLL